MPSNIVVKKKPEKNYDSKTKENKKETHNK